MALNPADYIERFGQKNETYRIPVSADTAEDFIVRCVSDVPSIMAIQKKAATLLKMSAKKSFHASWKLYMPLDPETANIVAEIVLLVQEPKFTDLQALELCHKAGPFASWLHLKIMSAYQTAIPQTEEEAIDDLKNDSVTTACGEPSSPSEEMSSENILAGSKKRNGMTRGNS